MKKIVTVTLLLLAAAGLAWAGGSQEAENSGSELAGDYAFGGSTTVMPIIEAAIEDFTEIYTDTHISYDAQGSSVGVKGALAGTYSLGAASRKLKDSEIADGAKGIAIALDGVAVIVNKDSVGITNLSFEQVGQIFAGQISNWNQVGGPDAEIVLFNRDEASGTRDCFKMTVKGIGEPFAETAAIVTSNGDMVSKVGSTPYAIGYCGFGYITKNPGTQALTVDEIEPEEANVINESYKISRPLNIIYTGELSGLEKVFIDYLLSEDGQAIVSEEGFIQL